MVSKNRANQHAIKKKLRGAVICNSSSGHFGIYDATVVYIYIFQFFAALLL